MERKTDVSIDNLLLSQENPRTEKSRNQKDAIEKIYKNNHKNQEKSKIQLIHLAESIAENGYQNGIEPILTLKKGKNYIVHDANRRLAAIKLLNNPDEYKSFLDESDFSNLNTLRTELNDNIPLTLEIISFDESEKDQLNEILARRHTGPQNGVGTSPWSTEAKDRFTGNTTFADRLEVPFEEQFGQTLSSYLGGSNAKTNTRRIFNSNPAKDYLKIVNVEDLTSDELDKIKEFADEISDYAKQQNKALSRINVSEIKDNLIFKLTEQQEPKSENAQATIEEAIINFGWDKVTDLNKHLGSKYFKFEWIFPEEKFFNSLNLLLTGLLHYGKLTNNFAARWQKAFLMAPSARVIFELSLKILFNEGYVAKSPSKDKHMDQQVEDACKTLFMDGKFLNYLSQRRIIENTQKEIRAIISSTNFKKTVENSNISSHTSAEHLNLDIITNLFNDAVLFAILTENYVKFKESTNEIA